MIIELRKNSAYRILPFESNNRTVVIARRKKIETIERFYARVRAKFPNAEFVQVE